MVLASSCISRLSSTSLTRSAEKVSRLSSCFPHARTNESHAKPAANALTFFFYAGLDCTGRLFISDRAHLVFDFHQIVDGLKEVELGGSSCVFVPDRPSRAANGSRVSQHRHYQERHRPRVLRESVAFGLARASPLRPRIWRQISQDRGRTL